MVGPTSINLTYDSVKHLLTIIKRILKGGSKPYRLTDSL